jgi:hypothetical protein
MAAQASTHGQAITPWILSPAAVRSTPRKDAGDEGAALNLPSADGRLCRSTEHLDMTERTRLNPIEHGLLGADAQNREWL